MNTNTKSKRATGINLKRAHFNAGSAKNSSGASFAQQFRAWWQTQTRFGKQADFADSLSVSEPTLQSWLMARAFPSDTLCEKLHAVTHLGCFGSAGREAARLEHEQKRGLSHAGIAKRAKRQYLTDAERAECVADPDKAFTIRGDAWIACIECGRWDLKRIHGKKPAGHLLQHRISDEEYRKGRYGKNVGLVCRELSRAQAARSAAAYESRLRKYAGTVQPPSRKGQKNPPEFSRRQSARMRGTRSPHLMKDVADVEFLWAYLIEGKDIRKTGEATGFTIGGAWARLKAIIGTPVRKTIRATPEFARVERAIGIIRQCADGGAALKTEMARLCEESRKEVVAGKFDARSILLLLPIIREWLPAETERASELAMRFLSERAWKLRRSHPRKNQKAGRPETMRSIFEQAKEIRQKKKLSWPKIAQQLIPSDYRDSGPRKAGEAIRIGVSRL